MQDRTVLRRTLLAAGVLLFYAGLISLPLGRTPPLEPASVALVLLIGLVIAWIVGGQLASPALTTRPAAVALLFLLHPAVYYLGLYSGQDQSREALWNAFYVVAFCGVWLSISTWSIF